MHTFFGSCLKYKKLKKADSAIKSLNTIGIKNKIINKMELIAKLVKKLPQEMGARQKWSMDKRSFCCRNRGTVSKESMFHCMG